MSHPSDDQAGSSFRVDARASGHSDIRMVVQGTQHNVENYYYIDSSGGPAHLRPFDLPNLRIWIDRITADYRHLLADKQLEVPEKETASQLRQLDGLRQSVNDPSARVNGKNAMRRLLAGGVAQYLSRAGQLPTGPIPEQLILDVTVFALWPVLEAPGLPSTWQQDLAELTSPRVATITATARDIATAGNRVDVETFARALSAKPVTRAVLNLFEDLGDPGSGGAALTAIALASGLPKPPQTGGAKAIATWAFGALGGAAIGVTASDIDTKVDELLDMNPDGSHHHHGSGSAFEHMLDDFLHHL